MLYLCSVKYKQNMKDVCKQPNESPIATPHGVTSGSEQQYFTAEEAMAFMEPRIRAMFR